MDKYIFFFPEPFLLKRSLMLLLSLYKYLQLTIVLGKKLASLLLLVGSLVWRLMRGHLVLKGGDLRLDLLFLLAFVQQFFT